MIMESDRNLTLYRTLTGFGHNSIMRMEQHMVHTMSQFNAMSREEVNTFRHKNKAQRVDVQAIVFDPAIDDVVFAALEQFENTLKCHGIEVNAIMKPL